jgi:hypothetical protein
MPVRGRPQRWFLLDWDDHLKDWVALAGARRAAKRETALVLQDLLEKQLDRANVGLAAIDGKAALVVPGVGIVAGVLVGHVSTAARTPTALGVVLILLVAMAAISVILSLLCLGPWWKRANGPEPFPVVMSTNEGQLAVRLGYLSQLGFAVLMAQGVLNVKAPLLNWAIRSGGAGVLCLLVFAAVGGLQ